MKKKRKIKKRFVILFCGVIFLLFLGILGKRVFKKNPLLGTWTSDQVTIYEFHKNHTGKLIVSLNEYGFQYKIKGDTLYIDFKNEKSEDSEYTYTINDNQLFLKNEKGIFIFTRK